MRTNQFKASIVFKKGDASASIIHYPKEPVESEELLPLSYHSYLKVNCYMAEDCHFTMYKNHNPELVYNSEGQHVVTDEKHKYSLCAYLGKKEDVLSNAISIITQLPKGLVMTQMEAVSEFDVYVFSGFNVMLLDEIPNVKN